MNVISNVISDRLIDALGWTLIHSLWQGAAAALGLALLMFLLRRFSPRTRYLVGVMALTLVLALAAGTFIISWQAGDTAFNQAARGTMALGSAGGALGSENLSETGAKLSIFKDYFSRHLPLIVTLWLLGVLVLTLRFAGGFLHNQRMKSYRTRPVSKYWQDRMTNLCRSMGIGKRVRLLESKLVKAPLTIGHFKPLVLFPLGMATGLPHDQVEALLIHELAHIFRRDYLVNIVQNLADILFFFHPGIRWISAQVRAERENCCDDTAAALSGDCLNVARALANVQEFGTRSAQPALAALGKKARLLSRVKRLSRPSRPGSEFREGFVGALVLGACVLALVVSVQAASALNHQPSEETMPVAKEAVPVAEEKVPVVEAADETEEEKQKEEQEKKEKELAKIEAEKRAALEKELQKRETELKRIAEEKLAMLEKNLQEKEAKLEKIEKETLQKLEEALAKQEEALAKQAEELAKQAEKLEKVDKEKLEKLKQEMELRQEEMKKRQQELQKRAEIYLTRVKEELKKREAVLKRITEQQLAKVWAELRKRQAELIEEAKALKEEELFIAKLKKELLEDKLIADEDDFEFKLTAKGLWIDGKKQPKKVFKKYTQWYEQHRGKKLAEKETFQVKNKK